MKKLRELKPDQCLYTIITYNSGSNNYTKIMISSRKVTKVERLNNEIVVHTEKVTECPLFGTAVEFNKDKQNCDSIIKNSEMVSHYYYFSEGALLTKVRQILETIKPSIKYCNRQDTIWQYYNKFMPTIIKMIYSNQTAYTILNNISV